GGAQVLNAYVSIAPDGTITIQSPVAEMGQGIMTGLPLIVAEELDADWSKVKVEQSPVAAAYHHPIFKAQYVVASISTLGYWTPMRVAGAQARRALIAGAAAHWGVAAAECVTEPSVVIHRPSGRKLGYGEIAALGAPVSGLAPIDPAKDLKPANQYRLVGKGVPRVDVPAKTNGSARYGIDARLPGMAYATIVRGPLRGSAPASSNADAVKKLPGMVDVVTLEHGVALVGETFDAVRKARKQLKVSWRGGESGASVNTDRDLETYLGDGRDPKRVGVEWKSKGDAAKALSGAARVMAREYLSDHVYHAQMEPMNATADVRRDGVDIWVGTQAPTRTQQDVAKALGAAADKVQVHQMFLGGGFGRRATVEASVDAALVSRAVDRPVKLILSREDDLWAGTFRPMTAQRIEAGLDAGGAIVGWRHRVIGEPVGDFVYHPGYLKAAKDRDVIFMMGAELPYYTKVANWQSDHVMTPERTRVAAWRGIGAGYTKFAVESMIDEIAHANKTDPLAFRLSLTDDSRTRRVLEKVAEMSGWGKKRPGNTALGLAFAEYGAFAPKFGSLIASVAEISVDRRSGKIRVHNYWAAADATLAVNPGAFAAQVESAVVWGLSAALKERVTMVNGVVQQSNFHEYEVLRMAEVPAVHVEVLSGGPMPTMVGELGVPGTAPAVANAFFALTGKRLYHMPFTPERVLAALKA
ncbi:MAG TPA: molybdopterin cofactor-binding domain-containing protein, partial [Burkholderiales bacterium]|nr:molybdopterin cofactor-binding domain-containing protein [Burkholderiales bacterium]